MPTDPTPQAEQRVCKWCLQTIVPPTNEMPYWSERIKFLGWHCLSQEGPGKHEPVEPSPAPPAEPFDGIVYFHEWVALGKPDRSYANWLEFQLATAQAALREHHEMAISEDQAYQGSDMYIKTLAALKPVSDRQPEGETKCQIG